MNRNDGREIKRGAIFVIVMKAYEIKIVENQKRTILCNSGN